MIESNLRFVEREEFLPLLNVSESVFRRHFYEEKRSALLDGFPPPARRGRKLLWVLQDIFDWLEDQRTYRKKLDSSGSVGDSAQLVLSKVAKVERKAGRPRKGSAMAGGDHDR